MKKNVFIGLGVMCLSALIPVALADISRPTETSVYFSENGVPYEGAIDYEVNCYGYSAYPGEDWFENPPLEGEYTPSVVFSYSASCPEYGCSVYDDYYMNYRSIDYCIVTGETDEGEEFYISDIGTVPYTSCEDNEDYWIDFEGYEITCESYFDFWFPDVTSDHANYDAIVYVEENGIFNGYPDGTFGPDETINRAEFVNVIVGAIDHNEVGCEGNIFDDFGDDVWYYAYVCIAKSMGIVGGYPDGTFRPSDDINFAEAAKVLVEGFGYDVIVSEADLWYEPYVRVLQDANAAPMSIESFDQDVTRGEMAEMIYRLRAEITDKESAQLL
ncbi:hypothetical protein COW94_02365 [Candidatus Peregrinibacteria bacterium CG22_combo_CG10-13_8_21_14_all_44_10]|nr:MAG: hypothetical protein COW94_02365 [Candidatus Peregrinibacteria bacterium CG22_combo_CG10-13_8_21_14_all_44_10]